jgi:hypothetical protein
MKWQKTSLPVVCLTLRLSAFEAGAAQVIGAASSHSAAEKRIMPAKGGERSRYWPNYGGGIDRVEMPNLEIVDLSIYSTKMRSCSRSTGASSFLTLNIRGNFTLLVHAGIEHFLRSRAIPSHPGFILMVTPSIPLPDFCSIRSYFGLCSGRTADA